MTNAKPSRPSFSDDFQRLRKSRELLDDIIDNIPTSVQLKSVADGYRIVMWNKAAESMYGLAREDALGRNVHDLWPASEADRMHASDLDLIARKSNAEFPDRPARTTNRGEIRVHMRKVPLYDAAGEPTHLLVIADDITARLEAEKALRQMQARYQRALDGSRDGIWEYNFATRQMFQSEHLRRMLAGPGAGAADRPEAIVRLVHPHDRRSYWRGCLGLACGTPMMWEGRLLRDNGGYRWLRVRGTVTFSDIGCPELASGTLSDIHEARSEQEELRRHRDNLAELVEERTASLVAAKQAAERANLAKSEFLANISHELRTPMHAIVSFANFGIDKFGKVEPGKLLGYFRNIKKSADRLLSLLNDLLDLARLEAGHMTLTTSALEVAELLRDAVSESEAFAQSRGVRLQLAMSAADLRAQWDGSRVLQVIRNLLSNAIKFSPSGGLVEISASIQQGAGGIEIRVRDQGVGIPDEELNAVFDKFVQSSRTKTGAGGTGLGLAICRQIIGAHGGSIRAANNPGPSNGAVFTITLPVAAPLQANAATSHLARMTA